MASRYVTPWSASRGWLPEPLSQVQREIDRVFDEVFSSGASSGSGSGRSAGAPMMSAPRIDLQEVDGELRLHADLPGVSPSDLDVRVEGDVLTIRGERKSENERNEHSFHVMERSHGRFQRSIQLPFAPNPDEVQATVREGVLEIRIPKHAPQERSKRIQVRGGDTSSSSSSAASGGGSITQAVGGGAGQAKTPSTSTSGAGASASGQGGSSGGSGSSSGSGGSSGGPTAVPAGQSSSSSPPKR